MPAAQKRKAKRFLAAGCLLVTLLLAGNLRSFAREDSPRADTAAGGGELIFLLDTSVSMNSQDQDRAAIEAIRQTLYSLPSGYRSGLVAYHTEIQAAVPLDAGAEALEQELEAMEYRGYTNAGEGLRQALDLFSAREGVERSIILLTDGEIDMPDPQQRESSRSLYREAAEEAAGKGIRIYIVAIGTKPGNPQMHIFDGAEVTGGAVYWEGVSGSLAEILNRILTERLNLPLKEISQERSAGEREDAWWISLPSGASRIRLVLMSEEELGPVTAKCQAESQRMISGKRFAAVELERPSSDQIQLCFEKAAVPAISAYLLAEYDARIQVTAQCQVRELERSAEEVKKNIPPRYEHFAELEIRAVDAADPERNLWDPERFEGTEVAYTLNRESRQGAIEKGRIRTTIPADHIGQAEITVEMEEPGAVWYISQADPVRLEKLPEPVFSPEPDYRPLWGILGLLALALAILALRGRKRDAAATGTLQSAARGKPPFSGKLNLYVVQSRGDEDIPPQTYRLFGRAPGQVSLRRILDTCGLSLGGKEADRIRISPGTEHSLIVTDQAEECTVMRGAEILRKETGYPVYYNEKLTVTFYEEGTEIEIYYKSLKPSEKEETG